MRLIWAFWLTFSSVRPARTSTAHQNYLNCGLTKRDDEIEMQKVQPGWRFQAVRW